MFPNNIIKIAIYNHSQCNIPVDVRYNYAIITIIPSMCHTIQQGKSLQVIKLAVN